VLGLEDKWELCCGTARASSSLARLRLGAALALGSWGTERGTAGCAHRLCESLHWSKGIPLQPACTHI